MVEPRGARPPRDCRSRDRLRPDPAHFVEIAGGDDGGGGLGMVDERALEIASAILEEGILPPRVLSDTIHATMAATHHADILLTWNCRHLANPELLPRMRSFMERRGLRLPEICTPVELLAESGHES